jgi:hypothetical protein
MDYEAHNNQRHQDQLPTAEARRAYVEAFAPTLEAAAHALSSVAQELRTNPDRLLERAFSPLTLGCINRFIEAEIQIYLLREGKALSIKGLTETAGGDVGFRLVCTPDGVIEPAKDDQVA